MQGKKMMLYQPSVHLSLGIGLSHTEERHIAINRNLSPPVVSLASELTAKRVTVARRCAHLLLYTTNLRGVNTTVRILGLGFVEETIASIAVGEYRVMAVNFAMIVDQHRTLYQPLDYVEFY